MEVAQEKMTLLRSKLNGIPALQKAEDTIKAPKEYLVVGGAFIFIVMVFFGVGAGVLCSMVGFIFPAYKSFEAIEGRNKNDEIQWLVYWVIFAFFSVLETFVDFLVYWIPFYYAFKLAFLLWAMLPQTKGAKFLYDNFLKDFLKKSESRIDAAMAEAKKSADTMVADLSDAADKVSKKVDEGTKKET